MTLLCFYRVALRWGKGCLVDQNPRRSGGCGSGGNRGRCCPRACIAVVWSAKLAWMWHRYSVSTQSVSVMLPSCWSCGPMMAPWAVRACDSCFESAGSIRGQIVMSQGSKDPKADAQRNSGLGFLLNNPGKSTEIRMAGSRSEGRQTVQYTKINPMRQMLQITRQESKCKKSKKQVRKQAGK